MLTKAEINFAITNCGYRDQVERINRSVVEFNDGVGERVLVGAISDAAVLTIQERGLEIAAVASALAGGAYGPEDYALALETLLGLMASASMTAIEQRRSVLAGSKVVVPGWLAAVE